MVSEYLLNSVLHDITNNSHLFLLSKAEGTTNSLTLNGRIPLRLNNINATCYREVQPVDYVNALARCVSWVCRHSPHSASPKSHQEC